MSTTKTAPRLAGHTLVEAATVTKFRRASLLARSLKIQRDLLADARAALATGNALIARALLASWHTERRAYRLALSWQSI